MKNQNQNITWLRAIACIFVIFIHSTDPWYLTESLSSPFMAVLSGVRVFSTCAVPLFYMITGALLLSKPSCVSLNIVIKRSLTILTPLIYFSAIYYAYDLINHQADYNFLSMIKSPLKSTGHLWFLYAILPAYVLLPFIQIPKMGVFQNLLYCAVVFIVLIAVSISSYYTFNFPLLWIFLGHGLKNITSFLPSRKNFPYLFFIGYIIASLITVFLIHDGNRIPNNIGVAFQAVCFFLFLQSCQIPNNSQFFLTHFITLISTYSLGIYGWHMISLRLLYNNPITSIPQWGLFAYIIPANIMLSLSISIIDKRIWEEIRRKITPLFKNILLYLTSKLIHK